MEADELIRDVVLPLAEVAADPSGGGVQVTRLAGTAFLIGNRGFAITAGHIAATITHPCVAVTVVGTKWQTVQIEGVECHPRVDVAILRFATAPRDSFLELHGGFEGQSGRYRLFGYPDDTAMELVEDGLASLRPDLVYVEGYIRRRVSQAPFPRLTGQDLYELSDIAGPGCSGAPVVDVTHGGPLKVIGVYVGEKATSADGIHYTLGYAVREDSFRDWKPALLSGETILTESLRHD